MYLSLADEAFMRTDRHSSLVNLEKKVLDKKFVRVLRADQKIVAWIYGDLVKLDHQEGSNFQQLYYCSDLKGFSAARAVIALHREMFEYASLNSNSMYCVSPGSHLDEKNAFARILERDGWNRRGHIAVRELPRKLGPSGWQVSSPRHAARTG